VKCVWSWFVICRNPGGVYGYASRRRHISSVVISVLSAVSKMYSAVILFSFITEMLP
jgi:hypothetical protein